MNVHVNYNFKSKGKASFVVKYKCSHLHVQYYIYCIFINCFVNAHQPSKLHTCNQLSPLIILDTGNFINLLCPQILYFKQLKVITE